MTELTNEEKRIVTAICTAISRMGEREKGYILGIAEGMAMTKKEKLELVQQ